MSLQPLPAVNDDTAAFWEGGVDGRLHIHRCGQCRTWFHPPSPVCPDCLSLEVGPEAASGLATVEAFTVNVQPWAPGMAVPYVVGVVSLDDAPGVQLTTRFVEVQPSDMAVGMKVEVTFEQVEDIFLPLFRPFLGPSLASLPAEMRVGGNVEAGADRAGPPASKRSDSLRSDNRFDGAQPLDASLASLPAEMRVGGGSR